MKKMLGFIAVFLFGALSFFLLQMYLPAAKEAASEETATTTSEASADAPLLEATTTEDIPEDTVEIAQDGSQLDGPFPLYDRKGEKTGGTVRFVRSPEENLIQFEDFEGSHSFASHIYLAVDTEASDFLNLGPAHVSEGVFVYGIPLDAQLQEFPYILIYDTQLERVEYYAKVR